VGIGIKHVSVAPATVQLPPGVVESCTVVGEGTPGGSVVIPLTDTTVMTIAVALGEMY
jgi:hypothetical protein